jgi:uncharacterized protein (DUF3820 family)
MPRDEWAKARAIDAAKRGKPSKLSRLGKKRQRSNTRAANHLEAKRLQSTSTKLWFGKHKGRTIQFLINNHPDYLRWLRELPPAADWRMKALLEFLKNIKLDAMIKHSQLTRQTASAAVTQGNRTAPVSKDSNAELNR